MLQLESVSHVYSFHSYEKQLVRLIVPESLRQSVETENQGPPGSLSNDLSSHVLSGNTPADNEAGNSGFSIREIHSTTFVYQDQLSIGQFPQAFSAFDESCLERLLQYQADIYLIGTGGSVKFPERIIHQQIYSRKLSIDFMDTGAACRTYNILSGEQRNVAALIFMA